MKYSFENISIASFVGFYFLAAIISTGARIFIGTNLADIVFHLVLFLLIYVVCLENWEREISFKVSSDSIKLSYAYILIPFLVLFTIGNIRNIVFISLVPGLYDRLYNNLDSYAAIESALEYILIFLNVVVLVPIVEELLFRRILFPLFCENNKPFRAMIYSSVFFMLAHGLSIQIFVFSMLLTMIYHGTGNIKYPILAHMLNNLIAFLVTLVASYDVRIYERVEGVLGITFLILTIPAWIWIFKDRKVFSSYLSKPDPIQRNVLER